RDAWIHAIRTNMLLIDVANSMIDEVTKAMVWEMINQKGGTSIQLRRRIHSTSSTLLTRPRSSPSVSQMSTLSNSEGAGDSPRLKRLATDNNANTSPNKWQTSSAPKEPPPFLKRTASSSNCFYFTRSNFF